MESSQGDQPPVIPPAEGVIPRSEISETTPDLAEVMKAHMTELGKRNAEVDNALFADIGRGDKRTLISSAQAAAEGNSYRMVVTEDGIMAIQISDTGRSTKGEKQVTSDISDAISTNDQRRFVSDFEGYDRRAGSGIPVLRIPGAAFELLIGRGGARSDLETYENVRLVTNPTQEIAKGMIQATRAKHLELSTVKAARAATQTRMAEGLSQI